jgi:hypothetical protein
VVHEILLNPRLGMDERKENGKNLSNKRLGKIS